MMRIAAALLLALGLSGAAVAEPAATTPDTGVFFAPDDVRSFVLAIAAPTAKAKSADPTREKVATFIRNANGEAVVNSVQLVPVGQEPAFPAGTIAVMIVRPSGTCQPPHSREDLAGLARRIATFFVDYRGQTIWEIGIHNQLAVFRQVNGMTDFGPEEKMNADPTKYTIYPCAKYD